MRTTPVDSRRATASRPHSTHSFPRDLARAARQDEGHGAERSGAAGPGSLSLAGRPSLREVLLRRRGGPAAGDRWPAGAREIDRFARLMAEWGSMQPACGREVKLTAAATLSAAVERLALAIEHHPRAEGPALELQFGRQLSIRLTRGPDGLELAISGEAAAAQLARAELPGLLARLKERGLAVSRAEVWGTPIAGGRGRPSAGRQR